MMGSVGRPLLCSRHAYIPRLVRSFFRCEGPYEIDLVKGVVVEFPIGGGVSGCHGNVIPFYVRGSCTKHSPSRGPNDADGHSGNLHDRQCGNVDSFSSIVIQLIWDESIRLCCGGESATGAGGAASRGADNWREERLVKIDG